jgi:hypothetical protein
MTGLSVIARNARHLADAPKNQAKDQHRDRPEEPQGSVVPFPNGTGRNLASPSATALPRMLALSDSWHDEPGVALPDSVRSDLIAGLPAAIEAARSCLDPGNPQEVLAALKTLADRKGFDLPVGLALDLDIEVMAGWPCDLFRRAFRAIWEHFSYRRMPEVGDFRKHIEQDLAERRNRLARLESMALRLRTVELRERWDAESRERGARQKEAMGRAPRSEAASLDVGAEISV